MSDQDRPSIGRRRLVARSLVQALLLSALLFGPAGTLAWPRGWAFVVLSLAAAAAVNGWLYLYSPALLAERFGPPIQKDQPAADKIVVVLLIAASLGWFVFIPLDVFHWRLLPRPPAILSWLGLALWLAGVALVFLTFRANAFAAPVVKHQAGRQRVIAAGPYAVVRHPMYAAMALIGVGVSLWLQSTAAIIAALAPVGVLIARIGIEEAHLKRYLAGYAAYTRRVRWRLAPYVW